MLIRDFTEEGKDRLKDIISDIERKQLCEFTDKIGDKFIGIFGGTNIHKNINNLNRFHEKIMDKNNTTKGQIDTIFSEVETVDVETSRSIENINELLKRFNNKLEQLTSVMNPAPNGVYGAGALGKPNAEFRFILESDERMNTVNMYINQLMSKNEDGSIIYNWDKLQEVMRKDPKDVTNAEYAALLVMYDSLSRLDENGEVVIDTASLQKFIECLYILDKIETNITSNCTGVVTYKFKTSPVCIQLNNLYKNMVDKEVGQNIDAYFTAGATSEILAKRQLCSMQVFKSTILNEVCTTINDIRYSDPTLSRVITKVDIRVQKVNKYSNEYKITTSGNIKGFYEKDMTIYMFNSDNSGIINNETKKIAESLKKDELVEGINKLSDQTKSEIIDVAWGAAEKFIGKKGVFAGKYGVELGKNHIEIAEFNKKMDKIGEAVEINNYLDALYIGSSISAYDNNIKVNYAYVNEEKLKIAIEAYNKHTNHQLSINKILKDINSETNISTEVKDYVEWKVYNNKIIEDFKERNGE